MRERKLRNLKARLVKERTGDLILKRITISVPLGESFYKGEQKKKSASGYESSKSIYECEDCAKCEYKSECTRAKGDKRLQVATNFIRVERDHLRISQLRKGDY